MTFQVSFGKSLQLLVLNLACIQKKHHPASYSQLIMIQCGMCSLGAMNGCLCTKLMIDFGASSMVPIAGLGIAIQPALKKSIQLLILSESWFGQAMDGSSFSISFQDHNSVDNHCRFGGRFGLFVEDDGVVKCNLLKL